MTNSLPTLRILPLQNIIEHEFNDDQRTGPLVKRLQAEDMLKNPPIVTPLDGKPDHYVVLDGANRCTALNGLGYEHILAQVVPYRPPQVTLTTWHHAITEMDLSRFIAALERLPTSEVHSVDFLDARAGLSRRDFVAYVQLSNGAVAAIRSATPKLHDQNRALNELVDTYKTNGKLNRVTAEELDEVRAIHPDVIALVIFPNYDPAEVLALARDGELLPPGLTRHLIQGRVLRANFPLSELRATDGLDAKNARLEAWLQSKFSQRDVRFYGEATYLFDE
jgi:ParB-like chromosome segregation protein Spo0J